MPGVQRQFLVGGSSVEVSCPELLWAGARAVLCLIIATDLLQRVGT